jgi:outer membrane lipoprotein-sorting protein
MKFIFKVILLFLSALIICPASSVLAASFSADMVDSEDGNTQTGKFFLSGPYYRMEIKEDGALIVIIADREKKIHLVLNIAEKTFYELSSDTKVLFSKDPFLLSDYIVSKYEAKIEGPEKINGIICEKQDVPSER